MVLFRLILNKLEYIFSLYLEKKRVTARKGETMFYKGKKAQVLLLLFILMLSLFYFSNLQGYSENYWVEVSVPSVDVEHKRGDIAKFIIQVRKPGIGKVKVNSESKIFSSVNASIYTAIEAVGFVLEADMSMYDIEINILAKAESIKGGSGGAGLAVGIISAILKVPIRNDAAITGSINPDGSIGPVGFLKYKAEGVEEHGFKELIIPFLNSAEGEKISKEIGLDIVPVKNVLSAFYHLTGYIIHRPTVLYRKTGNQIPICLLKQEAEKMEARARKAFNNLSFKLEHLQRKLHGFPINLTELEKERNALSKKIQEISQFICEGMYYTSLSYSFQVILDAENLSMLINYYYAGNKDKFLSELVKEDKEFLGYMWSYIEEKTSKIKGLEMFLTTPGQASATAFERAIEAAEIYNSTILDLMNQSIGKAIGQLVFVKERARTAIWWADFAAQLVNETGGKYVLPVLNKPQRVEEYINQKVKYARTMLDYALNTLNEYLQEYKRQKPPISVRAEIAIRNKEIETALNKKLYSTALIEAANAVVYANMLIIEIFYPLCLNKSYARNILGNLRDESVAWFMLTLKNRVNSLLPILYFEFGNNYYKNYLSMNKCEDATNSFIFLTRSLILSNVLLETKKFLGKRIYLPQINATKTPLAENISKQLKRERVNTTLFYLSILLYDATATILLLFLVEKFSR